MRQEIFAIRYLIFFRYSIATTERAKTIEREIEKKKAMNQCKKEAKELRATTFAIAKLEER